MYPRHKTMLRAHRGMGIATRMHRFKSSDYNYGLSPISSMSGTGAVKKMGGGMKRKPLSFRF